MNFEFENTTNVLNKNQIVILENYVVNGTINKITNENIKPTNWSLEIPKIDLKANIEEDTTDEVLNRNIGHFICSGYVDGNIALAAHNRGYDVNYFSRIKELELGDKVIYTYENFRKEYEVISKEIIKDTNVEVIENTENSSNMITLITCVENMPELRRCIKCAEIKNKNEN